MSSAVRQTPCLVVAHVFGPAAKGSLSLFAAQCVPLGALSVDSKVRSFFFLTHKPAAKPRSLLMFLSDEVVVSHQESAEEHASLALRPMKGVFVRSHLPVVHD